jgi:hypothetical protein
MTIGDDDVQIINQKHMLKGGFQMLFLPTELDF